MSWFMSEKPELGDFLTKLSEVLEVGVSDLTHKKLTEIPTFDSLGKIQVAAFVDQELDYFISQEELAECMYARDIFDCAANSSG